MIVPEIFFSNAWNFILTLSVAMPLSWTNKKLDGTISIEIHQQFELQAISFIFVCRFAFQLNFWFLHKLVKKNVENVYTEQLHNFTEISNCKKSHQLMIGLVFFIQKWIMLNHMIFLDAVIKQYNWFFVIWNVTDLVE